MAQPVRVVIADDTAHVRRMLRSMLELDGFEVVAVVAGGAELRLAPLTEEPAGGSTPLPFPTVRREV